MKNKFLLFLCNCVLSLSSFAQTQYDYYEGRNAYGGLNNAINGLTIIILLIIAFFALIVIAKIYVSIKIFFNGSPTNNTSIQNESVNTDNQSTFQIEKEAVDDSDKEEELIKPIEYHYVVITIEGNSIFGNLTEKDGKKSGWWYYYGITRITYNLDIDITYKIGLPIIRKGSCVPDSHINYEDLEFDTLKPVKRVLRLFIAGEFEPSKLQLMKIEEVDNLYDDFIIFYDGEGLKQLEIKHDEALEIISNLPSKSV